MVDVSAINHLAANYEGAMVALLRDLVRIPSESAGEKGVIERLQQELEQTGAYDKIWIDGLGNLLAQIGTGPRLIAIDAHVDTVGLGNRDEWAHDPYEGKIADGMVWGRGAGDQEGATPAMVYAGKIIRELDIPTDEFTLLLTFTVMEEDCDGLCWQYIVKEDKIIPEVVIVTDSTNCKILRGQRGRMEIGIDVPGVSCHGSMPHKGVNAVYKAAKIVNEIEKLNDNMRVDEFLGRGTATVSYISCKTPSMCAVPDYAYIHIDRRLTTGDTKENALEQVRGAVAAAGVTDATVRLAMYERPSWTGLVYPTENFFPTWVYDEDSAPVAGAVATHTALFPDPPVVSRWTFSTNGVSIAGMYGIPTVGFGPAEEEVAHTVNDRVPIAHMVRCAAFYAAFPSIYCQKTPEPVTAHIERLRGELAAK